MSNIIKEESFQVIYCYYTELGTFYSNMVEGVYDYDLAIEIRESIVKLHVDGCQMVSVYVVPAIENSDDAYYFEHLDIDTESLLLDKTSPIYVPKGLFYILDYQTKGEIFMFQNTGKLIFDSVEDKISAKGNPYRIVHIIDPLDYQRLEYFADNDLKVNCVKGEECTLVLKATRRGYSTNMTALAVNKK